MFAEVAECYSVCVTNEDTIDVMRKLRWNISRIENATDEAISEAHVVRELMVPDYAAEFTDDIRILRAKLDMLHELIKRR